MAINNPYIPGDPFSYDLKWIVRKLKEYGIFIEGAPATIEALVDEAVRKMGSTSEYINAKNPGHDLEGIAGDGVTDDTEAFQAIVQYCQDNEVPLYLPADCTMILTDDVTMTDMRNVILQGTIKGPSTKTLTMEVNAYSVGPVTWDITSIEDMKLVLKGMKNSLIRVQYATDLKLLALGQTDYYSIAYNTFLLGYLDDLTLEGDSAGIGGWINSNIFIGGRINSALTMKGKYPHNHNTFYGLLIEGDTSLNIEKGNTNFFLETRGEGAIAYNFDISSHGNLVTRRYTGGNPFIMMQTQQSAVTDPSGTNMVIYSGEAFMNIQETTLTHDTAAYSITDIYRNASGLHAGYTAETIMETDLIPIDKPVWLGLESDAACWRLSVEIYDSSKNRIITQPATSPVYGGTMQWTANNLYSVANVSADAYGFSRYFQTDDSGAAYIKARIVTSAAADFGTLKGYVATGKNRTPASFHFLKSAITAPSIPTNGTWEQGDVIFQEAPTAGGFVGWVCVSAGTPGTWKTFGAISS